MMFHLAAAVMMLSSQLWAQHVMSPRTLVFTNPPARVLISFEKPIEMGHEAFMHVNVFNRNDQPEDLDADLDVELWMPDHGHGSVPTQINRQLDTSGQIIPGGYVARNLYFVMPGFWEIRITLTKDQMSETKVVPLTLK